MSNTVLLDVANILAGYRRISDKEWILARLTALVNFMSKHGLLVKTIPDGGGKLADDTVLYRSDFTEEGFTFYYCTPSVARWIDNRKPNTVIDDVRPLERALKKLRDTGRDT